ncbi:MAG: glycosyltransferase [bacterium]|nr:glycosyltransferase [bacterium]
MKFLYVSNSRIPTGRAHGVQIMHMCQAFAALGADVALVVPGKRNFQEADPFEYYNVRRNFRIERVPVPDIGSRTSRMAHTVFLFDVAMFAMALFFSRIARKGDIIYLRDYPLLFLFSPRRNAVAIEIHDVPRWHRIFLAALKRASHIIAITHGVKDALIALGVPGDKILVAPDAVDIEEFAHPEPRASARARLGLAEAEKIALYIGRIDDWKGTDTFFEAAAFLPSGIRAAVIGGDEQQIAELKTRFPRVMFLGYHPYRELSDNQAAADCLVLPSTAKHEISARFTSPLKLFSYMASGRPIVASDLPSTREVIDEQSAYLVPPDDAEALAKGITSALNDARAAERSARARELVKNYTWASRAKTIMDALQ